MKINRRKEYHLAVNETNFSEIEADDANNSMILLRATIWHCCFVNKPCIGTRRRFYEWQKSVWHCRSIYNVDPKEEPDVQIRKKRGKETKKKKIGTTYKPDIHWQMQCDARQRKRKVRKEGEREEGALAGGRERQSKREKEKEENVLVSRGKRTKIHLLDECKRERRICANERSKLHRTNGGKKKKTRFYSFPSSLSLTLSLRRFKTLSRISSAASLLP